MKTYKELLAEISMGSRRPKFASSMGRSMGRDEEPTREEREANIEKLTAKIADPKEGAAFKAVYQRQIDAHKKALKEDLDEAIDPKLKAVIDKHKLKSNPAGTKIDDFDFTKEHEKDFKDSGHDINYKESTGKFHVTKTKTPEQLELDKAQSKGHRTNAPKGTSY